LNGRSAAGICDSSGRLIVYRAYQGRATEEANNAAIQSAKYLEDTIQPIAPASNDNKRGDFKQFYFILHRESQAVPRLSRYFLNNREAGVRAADLMKPIARLVRTVFRQRFAKLYEHYAKTLDFILERDENLTAPFHPFASFAVNTGRVVTKPHLDSSNFGAGLCCIVPFGNFDPSQDCRLGICELQYEVEVAPGVPIFIPSANFTHYNTTLLSMGVRGSVVLWTHGSLFQYSDLGGRTVRSLSEAERAHYHSSLPERIAEGVSRFPVVVS
ncbi:hypothetical protein BV20DRAFT_947663, partial [Pilatotrama ljubarskyi]